MSSPAPHPHPHPHREPGGAPDLLRRQRRLDPIYDLTQRLLSWCFGIGAGLLALGIAVAVFRGEPLNPVAEPFREVIPAVLAGRAAGIVDLAILWLMAAPVLAVLVVAVGLLRAGDRRYAAVSLLVLAILGVGIALAGRR